MENLNVLGTQVNSMIEAIALLGCTEETLKHNSTEVFLNGLNVTFHTYTTEGNENFYYSITVVNQLSNQYN